MYEMKPEYYIGIDMIDEEHKQLFKYADDMWCRCKLTFIHINSTFQLSLPTANKHFCTKDCQNFKNKNYWYAKHKFKFFGLVVNYTHSYIHYNTTTHRSYQRVEIAGTFLVLFWC